MLVIWVRFRYLERYSEIFCSFSKERQEREGGCLNTWGGEEQGLSCESLEEGVELNWPLTGRKETLGDIGEVGAQVKKISRHFHKIGTGTA